MPYTIPQLNIIRSVLTFILQSDPINPGTAVNKRYGTATKIYMSSNYNSLKTEAGISSRGITRYLTPYIAFLHSGQKVKNGIYPVILYSRKDRILIVAYGVSSSNKPVIYWDWDKIGITPPQGLNSSHISSGKLDAQKKYGDSYLKSFQNIKNFVDDYQNIDISDPAIVSNTDIEDIILKYKLTFPDDLFIVIDEYLKLFNGTSTGTSSKSSSNISATASMNSEDEMEEIVEPLADTSKFSPEPIINAIKKTGLIYADDLIKRYAYSLLTKPFVILSGLAGSGKTQLALSFALTMVENKEKQICFVPVGADWTNREPLLGYPNALKPGEYVKPESGVLSILMEAQNNPQKPYFLILDEMNLSYVERYFADFLSAMEAKGMKINLWDNPKENESEKEDSNQLPSKILLPRNLFITGTINVDETTYMFSPKVLDRANVIEFKISEKEMEDFLSTSRNIDLSKCTGAQKYSAKNFVEIATEDVSLDDKSKDILLNFFKPLKKVNAEFGYRTATEIRRFISLAKGDLGIEKAIDAAIVQKLLPKLHGSRRKIVPVLNELWKLSTYKDNLEVFMESDEKMSGFKYSLTTDKIFRMYKTAVDNGFTSFAEA